jgi:uncharacterized protein
MFEPFFYELKRRGVPVAINEWMTLQQALDSNLAESSMTAFYYLARAILVKSETFFDRYDLAFQASFRGIDTPDAMIREILDGLEKVDPLQLDLLMRQKIPEKTLEEILENFRKQYEKKNFDKHVGGNQAIGTGGTSTQGAFGYNPAGVRIGQGEGRHGRAVKIAEERRFRNYDPDQVLDTRQLRVALSRLRTLLPRGPEDDLDLDNTIDKTCRNAGDLELVFRRSKRNAVKLLLLMDSGGSMSPYARLVNLLFSAAKSQFRDFKFFYFHNCVYQDLWPDIERDDSVPTAQLLKTLDSDWKVIFVGDAAMAPSELLDANGCIDYFSYNEVPGVKWLYEICKKFPAAVWLNPEPHRWWSSYVSGRIISSIFPMFPLTLDGLDEAIPALLKMKRPKITPEEIQMIIERRMKPYAGMF